MTGIYEIYQGSQPIGTAEVFQEGLYFRFRCRCKLSGTVMHRISVCVNDVTYDLGIPVPKNDEFNLETRVPTKHFGKGDVKFSIIPHLRKSESKFYPISPEEPFAYLAKLRKAHMERRDDQIGIVLDE